jgi:predicted short-subunit dehydrogenase-like oxidoreductase (DUF2520 family)
MISVCILGAGNVATHLFNAFNKSDKVVVNQWFNRTIKPLQPFKNDVEIIDDLAKLVKADVYIIAVTDDAIFDISKRLPFEDRLVVHTSGSVTIHDLDKKLHRGVFYPLQTFSKDVEINFANVPFCLEVLEKENLETLKNLAEAIGSPHSKINTEQRQTLHLAAVFINNFTNQLYRVGHEISDAKNINFDILKPLILETAKKVQSISPYLAQTGPAKRHDKKTIKRHLKLLENKMHEDIYELLTKAIKQTHGKKL